VFIYIHGLTIEAALNIADAFVERMT